MSEANSNVRIIGVNYAGDRRLDVMFANNQTRTVNLSELISRLKGLRPLRDGRVFSRAIVGEGGYSIEWPGEVDIGASRIFEIALEQAGRSDAVEFIQWRWRNGLSLSDAADALGLSRRQVAYYASGEHEVPRHILLACKGWEAEKREAAARPGVIAIGEDLPDIIGMGGSASAAVEVMSIRPAERVREVFIERPARRPRQTIREHGAKKPRETT